MAQNYRVIWSEEFNYSGKPDPGKWTHEQGFIRNLEKQIYTSRKKNARVKNGKLEITAKKEIRKNHRYDPAIKNYRYNTAEAEYTSASIHTAQKFEFLYGRVDVRAKLPKGNGVWPAIWMLGANFEDIEYPLAGEIDIMEHVGKNPNEIHGTVHYPWNNRNGITSSTGTAILPNPSENFHIYSIDWTPETISFLVDNEIYHTFSIDKTDPETNPFHRPFYIILNLALGGKWAGAIDQEIFPQKFIIDYVRVYQRVD